jgi:hypothetical protein
MSGVFIPLAQWIKAWSRRGGADRRAWECGYLQGAQDRSGRSTVALVRHAYTRFSPSCPASNSVQDQSNRRQGQPPAGGSSRPLQLADGRVCQRPSRGAASAQGNREGRLARRPQALTNAPTAPTLAQARALLMPCREDQNHGEPRGCAGSPSCRVTVPRSWRTHPCVWRGCRCSYAQGTTGMCCRCSPGPASRR